MARRPVTDVAPLAVSDEMVEAIAEFYDDPLGFVYFVFPWGEDGTELHDQTGPDEWQEEFLSKLREAVRARKSNAELGAYLAGAASGHGVGKSTLVAWVILWFISTRVDPAIVVTANTQSQLNSKTWRELAKWHRLALNGSWFQWTATRLYYKPRPETWFAQAVPWTKENSEAFAGTHAKDVLIIMDEGSGIDDAIWEVAEGALTTAGAIWLVFGNPTKNTGRFRECFRRFRHRWDMMRVDSRDAKQANKTQLQKWVDDYGEDSDFVRVRVRGEFPRASNTQLIGTDLVENGQMLFKQRFGDTLRKAIELEGPGAFFRRRLDDNPLAPKIMALDVARKGGDQSVIVLRQGKTALAVAKWRELDAVQLAARVAEWLDQELPDLFVVDEVGVGAGVADILESLGYAVERCNPGVRALEERKFFNRRAEMWWKMRDWLREGGRIDHLDAEFMDDLTSPEYGYSDRGERIQLESKDDMRERGLPSPDTGDALSMTFWMPVAPRTAAQETLDEKIARAANNVGGGGATRTWMSYGPVMRGSNDNADRISAGVQLPDARGPELSARDDERKRLSERAGDAQSRARGVPAERRGRPGLCAVRCDRNDKRRVCDRPWRRGRTYRGARGGDAALRHIG